jgi:hypothetical protein
MKWKVVFLVVLVVASGTVTAQTGDVVPTSNDLPDVVPDSVSEHLNNVMDFVSELLDDLIPDLRGESTG